MPLIMGEFLVMSGAFFLLFLILITCINADKSNSTERAFHRRLRRERDRKREIAYRKHQNRYR